MSEENFDAIAEDYDESLPPHVVQHYLDKRVAYILANCPRGKALDVGCGTGVLAGRLAAAGYDGHRPRPLAGDARRDGEDRADRDRACAATAPGCPSATTSSTSSRPSRRSTTSPSPRAVHATLKEMARVTRPGGRIVVWDHNPRNPYWRSLMKRVPQDDGTERLIPEAEVLGGLRAGGAEIISSDQLGLVPEFVPPSMMGAMKRGERLAERTPGLRRLCAHNVVLARGLSGCRAAAQPRRRRGSALEDERLQARGSPGRPSARSARSRAAARR